MTEIFRFSKLYYQCDRLSLFLGDSAQVLKSLDSDQFACVVTSPPFFNIRDYGQLGEIGSESSPDAYLDNLTEVFAQCLRVMKPRACLWIELGETYNNYSGVRSKASERKEKQFTGQLKRRSLVKGYREKEPLMIPFRLIERLRAIGFVHRSINVWAKPNAGYDSAIDRPKCKHSYILQFIKPERATGRPYGNCKGLPSSVFTRFPSSVKGHSATYPVELVSPLIEACSEPGEWVLDPFVGSGSTAIASLQLGRRFVGVDLSAEYLDIACDRLNGVRQ